MPAGRRKHTIACLCCTIVTMQGSEVVASRDNKNKRGASNKQAREISSREGHTYLGCFFRCDVFAIKLDCVKSDGKIVSLL